MENGVCRSDDKAFVKPVVPTGAEAQVQAIYAQIEAKMGKTPVALQLFSLSPELLMQIVGQFGYYMQHPRLSPALLASIRLLIAKQENCQYCVTMNAGILKTVGFEQDLLEKMQQTPEVAPLNEREKAMLLLVLKASSQPHTITVEDFDAVRKLEWTDRDILEAINHGAAALALDRVLDAFNVTNELSFS